MLGWLTTTDHKRVGLLYFWATLVFFGAGGVEALMMRTQLSHANSTLIGPGTYDELFTLHGMTMIFWFIIPMTTGAFGNYLIPLMIGARDMAFPRMNALSFWIFVASGIFLYVGLFLHEGPNAGWFDYVPLASRVYDPGRNIEFYTLALIFNGISSTLTAAQFIVTIFKYRAPGMSFNRIPLFCFAFLAASFGLLFALPSLSADLIYLFLDRNVGTWFFEPAHGGSTLLWQHLFWFFGHPEVYILIVPAFGIATEIIPALTQRKMIAFPLVAIAELLVVFIGFGVWAHHMFATGIPQTTLVFFAGASAMVVIPSTIQVWAWCSTIFTGLPRFKTPLLFIVGFILFFVIGGLSGIMFVAIPFDQQVTDSYFVIAHFHYIIFGAAVFPIFGGMYYWFPKLTGRMYFERWGQISFWVIFVGTNLLFFPMHIVGLLGMPRRVYTYPGGMGWTVYNVLETIGGFVTLAGILLLFANLWVSYRRGPRVGPDPWRGPTLEWTVPSPPPEYNFAVIPTVTSAYPNWDVDDRERDVRRLERGDGVLVAGHEQVQSSLVDARLSQIVRMPHSSPWPILLALCLSGLFAVLVTEKYGIAAIFAVLVGLTLVGWHAEEPHTIDEPRAGMAAAWWGMAMLIAAEATLFAIMVGTYFYLRFKNLAWPPHGIPQPKVVVSLILLGVLLTSVIPVRLAFAALRDGFVGRARALLVAALVLQAGYFAMEVSNYQDDLHHFTPHTHAYGSIYYVLLGASHAHVALGILLDLWILAKLVGGVTRYRLNGLQAISFYWLAVGAITTVVTLTTLSPAF
ncbi:MAG TPA: cbb3-type cytochrome c oxidase subunit I [Gaiellaceae bacterium]|nr:cbb3-type cytochrome c oxidase subunit I [Gaiellaceae bacterium]